MKIRFNEIDDTVGAIERIQRQIFANLSPQIFFIDDDKLLVFNVLNLFNFRKNSYTLSDTAAIEKSCVRILKLTDLNNGNGTNTPMQLFIRHIIGFGRKPQEILKQLSYKTKNDLTGVLTLIERYQNDLIVRRFLSNGKFGNSHEDMVKQDFYNRCVEERDKIVKYIYTKMEERAIWKARLSDLDNTLIYRNEYQDRPYRWWMPRSIEFFDDQRINLCRHRMGDVLVKDLASLELLYSKGQTTFFYRKLEKYTPVRGVFNNFFNYYLPLLPKVVDRKNIIIELQQLFETKKWYGFTALALTQVEGIFSDMLHILNPRGKYSALPGKVSAVRPFYDFQERNFDYFQYHLPRLRNSFLHAGSILDRDFKIISLDLLYDLNYLMSVFHELQDPHLELHKLIKKGNCDFINGMQGLGDLLNLVKAVNTRNIKGSSPELQSTLVDWSVFEKTILANSGLLEHYAIQWNVSVDTDFLQFFNDIDSFASSNNNSPINLETLEMKDIIKSKIEIFECIKKGRFFFKDRLDFLNQMKSFLNIYKTIFKNCPTVAKSIFDNIYLRNKERFVKINFLKDVFDDE